MMVKKNYCNVAYCEGYGRVIPNTVTDVVVCERCLKNGVISALAELVETKQ
jgi:hypothetical protein